MDPCIGPPRCYEGMRLSGHHPDLFFHHLLEGHRIFLPLPTVVASAVIGHHEPDVFVIHDAKRKGNPDWIPLLSVP